MLRFPPKKIMVPMDLSDVALTGWKLAKNIGDKLSAKVEAIYVQEWVYAALGRGAGDPYVTVDTSRRALSEIHERIGEKTVLHPAIGTIDQEIVSWGKKRGFDLIVMGTHGRTGLERAVKGSVAETIVRHSSVPVLVARQGSAQFNSILAPVNLESYSWDGLLLAAQVAQAFSARLIVLHVVSAPLYGDAGGLKGTKGLLADFIERLPSSLREACNPKMQLAFGDPSKEIVSAAEDVDLVVLTAHRKGFLRDTILGTTAERVLRHSPKSVLAVPSSVPARKHAPKGHRKVPAHAA